MKQIYILEHFDFTKEQFERLNKLGEVHYFKKASNEQINEAINKADVIMVSWVEPEDIIIKMKKGSFMCLAYTGYNWISTLKEAVERGVIISNVPNYATNSVAEQHLALMLACAKKLTKFDANIKQNKEFKNEKAVELFGKTVGIIGLGHIGARLSELLHGFGVKILTCNSKSTNAELNKLLTDSDFVCVTCNLNDKTKNMISNKELDLMKDNSILTTTTAQIIDLDALNSVLKQDKFFGVGLEGFDDDLGIPEDLLKNEKVVCTWHNAYNTNESEFNRIQVCLNNIEAYINGNPVNIIKL